MGDPIFTGAEMASKLSGTFNESYYAISEKYNDVNGSYDGLAAQAVESNDGGVTWGPLNGDAPVLLVSNASFDITYFDDLTPSGTLSSSGPGSSGSMSGPVYQLTTSESVSADGPYLIMGDGSAQFPFEAYLADMNDDGTIGDLSPTPDASFSASPPPTLGDLSLTPIGHFTNGTYTAVSESSSGPGSSGGSGGYVAPVDQTSVSAGDDRVQVNVASSSSALSGMIDAAEGLDSLHLDGLSIFSDSSEDLNVDSNDIRLHPQWPLWFR